MAVIIQNVDPVTRVLAVGDLHIRLGNFDEMKIVLDHLIECVKNYRPQLVVLLGDTLHHHGRINVKEQTYAIGWIDDLNSACRRVGALCHLLIGNHDRPNNSDFFSPYHPFVGYRSSGLTIVSSPHWEIIGEMTILSLPYVPPGRLAEALRTASSGVDAERRPDLILCHQEFKGADMEGYLSVEGDDAPPGDCLVISGHIHTYQKLPKVIYVGTPIQQTFGEDTNKGFSLFKFSKHTANFPITGELGELKWNEERIASRVSPRITLHVNWDELDDLEIDVLVPTKLIIRGSLAQLKSLRHAKLNYPLVKWHPAPILTKDDTINTLGFQREQLISCSFSTLMGTAISERPDLIDAWREIQGQGKNEPN